MHNRPLETLLHPHHVSLLAPGSSTLQTFYHGLDDRLTPANFALDHGRAHRNLGIPRFNVYESSTAYILYGEMSGVRELADVAVEWLQGRVLLVHGVVPVEDEEAGFNDEEELESGSDRGVDDVALRKEFKKVGSSLCHAPKHLKAAINPDGELPQQLQNEARTGYPLSLLCERQIGQFQRSFTFPVDIEASRMKSKLEHGLLKVWLPKKTTPST